MSAHRPSDRPIMGSGHDVSRFKPQPAPVMNNSRHFGGFNPHRTDQLLLHTPPRQPGPMISPNHRGGPMDSSHDMRHHTGSIHGPDRHHMPPGPSQPSHVQYRPTSHQNNRIDLSRERPIHSMVPEKMTYDPQPVHLSGERPSHNMDKLLGHPSASTDHLSSSAPHPKKARYDSNRMKMNQLRIDTSLTQSKMEPAAGYHPETEAISPTLPTESHDSKSDIVNSISQVDREINQIEMQIQQLEKKQQSLEAEAAKPKEDITDEDALNESKPLTPAQIVYSENKKLAQRSQNTLAALGPPIELPLYNQPWDTEVFHENLKSHETFKTLLQSHFKRRATEKCKKHTYLSDLYEKEVTSWLKKVDAKTLKKSMKDQSTRQYFEQVFPEIKKSREDKERITSRVTSRGASGGYARTEAEFEQIIDGINEQEEEDKKMKAYAIIPPMLDLTERRLRFINRNGLMKGTLSEYKQSRQYVYWSPSEESAFQDKYLEKPKQFGQISDILEKKSLNDCVLFYYSSKKTKNYKQQLKKQVKRPHRKQTIKPSIRNSNEVPFNAEQSKDKSKHTDDEESGVPNYVLQESKAQCCVACGSKIERYNVSHSVSKNNCSLYGLDEQNYQPDWRICANCAKLWRKQNNRCPIPSCTTPRTRRIRYLPIQWNELDPEIRSKILKELEMNEEVNKCCSSCYDKISDLLGSNDGENDNSNEENKTKWSESEVTMFKEAISKSGKKWAEISLAVASKTPQQCKMYFYRNRRKQNLDSLYNEYKRNKHEESGGTFDQSDDSAFDEDDDDNLEDNDLSSDNDVKGNIKIPEETKPEVKNSEPEKVNGLLKQDALLEAKKEQTLPIAIKTEKVEYDSSATASADEIETTPIPKQAHCDISTSKAIDAIKRDPVLMENPDGMIGVLSYLNKSRSQAFTTTSTQGSTSVKDLIDFTIEDALTGQVSQESSSGYQSRNSETSIHNRLSMSSREGSIRPDSNPNQCGSSKSGISNITPPLRDDPTAVRRQAYLPQFKGDPRDILPTAHTPAGSSNPYSHLGDKTPSRAPPPAHSHHRNPMDQRNSNDRKSPAKAPFRPHNNEPFSSYDGPNHRVSPSMNKIGMGQNQQPPPLISNQMGSPSLPASQMKRENTHAGGSILQGTSAGHSNSLHPHNRFEGGSISHGTPRNQGQDVKTLSAVQQASLIDERSSRSPRTQQPSPVIKSQSNQPTSVERLYEQQQQQAILQQRLLMDYFRQSAGGVPPSIPTSLSVLQNDFLTAQQMSDQSNLRTATSGFPMSLFPPPPTADDKAKEQLMAAQMAFIQQQALAMGYDQQMVAVMLQTHQAQQAAQVAQAAQAAHASRLLGQPRMLAPTTLSMASSTHQIQSLAKDEAKLWSPALSASRAADQLASLTSSASRQDQVRSQIRPGVIPGLPTKLEMLPSMKPTDLSRRSASPSPHLKQQQQQQTQFEREIEDMRRRTISERTRSDSERTLTDTESSSQPPNFHHLSKNPNDYVNLSRSTPVIGGSCNESKPDISPFSVNSSASFSPAFNMVKTSDDSLRERREAEMRKDFIANERRSILEEDRKLLSAPKTDEIKEMRMSNSSSAGPSSGGYSYNRGMDLTHPRSRSPYPHKFHGDNDETRKVFNSKKLAEVNKRLEKDQLHKDASSLFSSSFEKDSHHAARKENHIRPEGPDAANSMTTTSIIDAIIMQQINLADADSNSNPPPTSLHQTSVIMGPKKSRMIQSRSDTDLPAHMAQSSTHPASIPTHLSSMQQRPSSSGESSATHRLLNHTDNMNDNARALSASGHLTPRPVYKVHDVEPISPPNPNSQKSAQLGSQAAPLRHLGSHSSNSSAGSSTSVGGSKKHSGIRSLLGADNQDSSHKSDSSEPFGSMSTMEYVKNKIEEAIRHDTAADHDNKNIHNNSNSNGLSLKPPSVQPRSLPHIPTPQRTAIDRHHDEHQGSKDAPKKRALEAMLKPSVSPKRAKSPEEVDIYSNSSSSSNNPFNIGRPMLHQPYRNTHAVSSSPSSFLTAPTLLPSNSIFGKAPMQHSGMAKNSMAPHPSSQPVSGMNHRNNSAEKIDGSTDENSLSSSMLPMTRPSPMDMNKYMAGMASSLHNQVMMNRQPSPATSTANRHSPIQQSRQSPLMNKPAQFNSRRSPIDSDISRSRSPLVNKDSPTGRLGASHPLSDFQRDRSSYKAESQNYETASKHSNLPKPLLSEQYETLSDDE